MMSLPTRDLHHEGFDLLTPYKTVLTGSHPEYRTGDMLSAVETYLQNGGRMMYLGGNGFYWVTADRPATAATSSKYGGGAAFVPGMPIPGEYYLSTTVNSEDCGAIAVAHRSGSPGVGFTAQGFDNNQPYRPAT